jgi:hypothetical protein
MQPLLHRETRKSQHTWAVLSFPIPDTAIRVSPDKWMRFVLISFWAGNARYSPVPGGAFHICAK